MELKLDRNRKYALALEGGGARGSYEVGVWDALEEAGIDICAVSGTSVGAIVGAFVAMGELELGKKLWREVTISDVIEADEDVVGNLMKLRLSKMNLKETARTVADAIKNGGFEVRPLLNLFEKYVDEDKVRNSDKEFYIITTNLSDLKENEIRARDLKDGELHQMMLASAYLPVFKNNKLGGKRYVDGGFMDNLPIHVLVENGYKDIIAVSLNSIGRERKVKLPGDVTVYEIEPNADLGTLMGFDHEQAEKNLQQGYYDGRKMLYGLTGDAYCVERTLTEEEAYARMREVALSFYQARKKEEPSLRYLNEKVLPRLARRLVCTSGDYYDLFLNCVETAAADSGVSPYAVYKDTELYDEVIRRYDVSGGRLPKAFTGYVLSLMRDRLL